MSIFRHSVCFVVLLVVPFSVSLVLCVYSDASGISSGFQHTLFRPFPSMGRAGMGSIESLISGIVILWLLTISLDLRPLLPWGLISVPCAVMNIFAAGSGHFSTLP